MKYPIVAHRATLDIAKRRIALGAPLDDLEQDLGRAVNWYGTGPEMDTEPFESARQVIGELIRRHEAGELSELDPDQLEGQAALELYSAIEEAGVSGSALDDPMFWSWVSLACLWNFVVWRQPRAFAPGDGSADAWNQYIDGRLSYDCVASRMYLRVAAIGGPDHRDLAYAVKGGTDLWRSHILRVRIGEHPPLVRAVIRRQAGETTRLTTKPLRAFAKELTRTITNLVPALLDDEEADELVGELWDRQLNQGDPESPAEPGQETDSP